MKKEFNRMRVLYIIVMILNIIGAVYLYSDLNGYLFSNHKSELFIAQFFSFFFKPLFTVTVLLIPTFLTGSLSIAYLNILQKKLNLKKKSSFLNLQQK